MRNEVNNNKKSLPWRGFFIKPFGDIPYRLDAYNKFELSTDNADLLEERVL
jgi:hypothetical protein